MVKIFITNVLVLDNPSSFFKPFQFKVTFECIEELKDELEWKMIYVGSAESQKYDQVLDAVYVGPVPEGYYTFVFQADPPDTSSIPEQNVLGATSVLLTCSFRGQECIRVGFSITYDYTDQELRENPPPQPLFDKLTRNIVASKPRFTRFKINWDNTIKEIDVKAGSSKNMQTGNGMESDDLALEEPQDESSLLSYAWLNDDNPPELTFSQLNKEEADTFCSL